jgi:hypothetical protein
MKISPITNKFLFLIVICAFILMKGAHGIDVQGDVWGIWQPTQNPYNVIGDLRVPPESTLQINAGCQIVFQNDFRLSVDTNATLTALGSYSDSIRFTTPNDSIKWGGIRLAGFNRGLIQFCIIEYGDVRSDDSGMGGGIFINNSLIYISRCCIRNNVAKDGGGIYCHNSFVNIDSNQFLDNHAERYAGGIYLDSCDNSLIIGNNIHGNWSDSSYGGGYIGGDSLYVIGNNFSNNRTYNYGGGLSFNSSGIQFYNNTISHNLAMDGGGIALVSEFYCRIGPNLITENHLTGPLVNGNVYGGRGRGGGVYSRWADIDYRGTTISFNTANIGGGIFRDGGSIISIGDPVEPCNIYSNLAGCGNDLYASGNPVISVYIDTFTVSEPDPNAAFDLTKFDLHIEHGYYGYINVDIYVSPSGDNFNDGITPSTPLKNIAVAMIRAQSSIDHFISITALPGRYGPSSNMEYYPINIKSGVKLNGGSQDSAIIDGEFTGSLFAINYDSSVTIEDLSLINGYGAIIINSSSEVEIKNNLFENNITDQPGAGIYVWEGLLNINHNIFTHNSTSSWWAGGGAMFLSGAICRLENNTIYSNVASNEGGALYFQASNILANNNIFWLDTAGQDQNEIYINYVHNMYEFRYNDIQGGFPGDGNINADPAFLNPDNGDFHLAEYSPCIDAGDPRSSLDPDSSQADIGAYYYDHRVGIYGDENGLPLSISLEQNYPNPFNNYTIIRYSIDKKQPIRLEIYDVGGRMVSIIQEEEVGPGLHELIWNANNSGGNTISSGIYFYRLAVGNKEIIKKMLLLK